jgi:mono/diheme cytochrome c family protein
MARWARATVITLIAVVILVAGGLTATVGWRPLIGPRARPLADHPVDRTPTRLERGRYLVEAVTGCLFCHSDNDKSRHLVPVGGTEGAGRNMALEDAPFLSSPNITPDAETGAGHWSDDALARAIREGIGHDGRALHPLMPYPNYRQMADEDLAAVIVYVRALKPVRRATAPPALPFPMNRLINDVPQPIEAPVRSPDPGDLVARGRYLTTIASCADCHTPHDAHGRSMTDLAFAGGQATQGSTRRVAAANLTPDPSGIPYYDEHLFVDLMRTGFVGAREVTDAMPYSLYGGMTDDDLRAIFAFLKTLAPVRHRIDNDLEPTDCPRCGLKHGGGNKNQRPAE